MVDWMEMCQMTKEELDRELQQQEIEFLKWIYEKHKKEKESEIKSDS